MVILAALTISGKPKASKVITIAITLSENVSNLVIEGEKVKVRAHIEKISGYSSHKDSNNLVEFVSHTVPKMKRVFVAMGESKSSSFLAQRLRAEVGVDAIVQEKNKAYELF